MRVVMIEADEAAGKLLRFVLSQAEHRVVHVTNTTDALKEVLLHETDAVLMEANLPNEDGFELCAALRAGGYQGPVLFVSERIETEDKLAAFAQGADDYIVKPYHPSELLVRVEAVARRHRPEFNQPPDAVISAGDVELSIRELVLRLPDGRTTQLTPIELGLLQILMQASGTVVSRSQLITQVWGEGYSGRSNRLDVYIRRLRQKIEPDPKSPSYLHTVRGDGYVFKAMSVDKQADRRNHSRDEYSRDHGQRGINPLFDPLSCGDRPGSP